MTIILNRQHQIYKVCFLLAFAALLILPSSFSGGVYAKLDEEKNLSVDYSKFNIEATKNAADEFFQIAIDSQSTEEKKQNLKDAAAKYYIMLNLSKSDTYPCIQLARIYDLQNNDAYAKAYFYRALGLNYKDADANFYFAEFYYARKQYKKALEYYQKALSYGRNENSQTLKIIGQIYERFSDIPRANYYYKKSLELNPQDSELSGKINENVKQEYEKSGYYKRRLRN